MSGAWKAGVKVGQKIVSSFQSKPIKQPSYAARRTTSTATGTSLKELLNQYRINQKRIKLINKALQSQQRGALSRNTKKSLRQGYEGGPDMQAFEGLTGIRKNQAGIIKRLRSMGYSTPSRAFKSSR